MNIDRSSFYLLAMALATQGCEVSDDKGEGGTSAGASNAGAADQGAGGTGSGAGGAGDLGAGGAGTGASGAGDLGAGGAGTGASGAGDVGGGGTPVIGGCTPSPITCDANNCEAYCNAAKTNLSLTAAIVAKACLDLDESAYCDNGYGCVSAGLADFSLGECNTSPESNCAALAELCYNAGDLTATEEYCHQLMDGLSETSRQEVAICIDVSDCSYGLYSCAEGEMFL